MKKLITAVLLMTAYTLTAYTQTNPNNQVIVYFKTGAQRVAPSNTTANVTSNNILNVLANYNIPTSNVVPSFPAFAESDTINVEAGESSRQMNRAKVFTITITNPATKGSFITALNGMAEVLYAETNGNVSNNLIPADGRFGQQWGMRNTIIPGADIHADPAWDIFTGNPNAIIAIIDNGVDVNHNDLAAKIFGGDNNFQIGVDGLGRQFSHGSHVAGIAAAITNNNNNNGVAGVDWEARIHPRNIFDGNGDPDITQSIIDAVNFNVNVWTLNNSWGLIQGFDEFGIGIPGRYSITVRSAFAQAYRNNRVSCVAMGNHQVASGGRYAGVAAFPAGYNSGIIAVGATDMFDNIANFSAEGQHIDVGAPGVNILSTNFNNGYIDLPGTSMATPHVAGLASLLKGFNVNLFNDDIEQIIRLSADDIDVPGLDNASGTGRINAQRALQFLQAPNTVQHLNLTGGTITNTTGNMTRVFLGVPGLPDAAYIVRRSEVRRNVTFPVMCNIIGVWGRGIGTTGFREENGRNFGEGICEVVPGSLTNTAATLRTWIYEVWSVNGQYLGFYPRAANNVVFQYTILGTPSPVQSYTITGSQTVCTNVLNSFQLGQALPVGGTINWAIQPNDGSVILTPNGNDVDVDASSATPNTYYTLTATVIGNCVPLTTSTQFYVPSAGWSGSISGYYGWGNTVYGANLQEGDNNLYMYGTSAYEMWVEGTNAYPGTSYWEYVSGDRASWGGAYTGYLGFDFSVLSGVDSYYNFTYTDDCGTHTIPYHFIGVYGYPPQYRGIQPTEKYKLSISPNPVNNIANIMVIETDSKAVSKTFDYNTPKTISVYDRMGTLVIQRKLIVPKSGIRLDVSPLRSNDVYNVVMEDRNGIRLTGRLIKK
ncbi:MAG: S8 family serine peptidase [Chitinophagaceae bacterium]